jgi:hypothetical protein
MDPMGRYSLMRRYRITTLVFGVACVAMTLSVYGASLEVTPSKQGAVVRVDGELFAEYVTRSGNKPIVWPILGPGGKRMTRWYPMANAPRETRDHVHHRSLWFTHGDVNGVNFWAEGSKTGTIAHRKFTQLTGGATAIVAAQNDWLAPDGKKVLEDHRRLTFGVEGDARWIDFDITLAASEGPVKFGDTKEGMFAVRVAESMKVDAKLGGKLVNSEGQVNDAAWGRPAAWVDYVGPVDGKTLGIAIFNHPSSFRAPTHWHVRTYGLFAANPFGWHDFPGGEHRDGSYTIERGKSIAFFYRVWLHSGDTQAAGIAEAFRRYQATKK